MRRRSPWWMLLLPLLFLAVLWQKPEGFTRGVLIRRHQQVSDYLVTYWPNVTFWTRWQQRLSRTPQWKSLNFSGTPLVGDPQSGLGYPPSLLHLVLPTTTAFNVLLLLHVVWGTAGMLVLARQRGLSLGGQVLTAGAFALFPRLYGHWGLGHISLVYAATWMPWAWAGFHGLWSARPWLWAGVLGVALGVQLSQHFQIALYTVLGMVLWMLTEPYRFPLTPRWTFWIGLSGVWALGASAPVMAPLLHHRAWWARSQGLDLINLDQGAATPVDFLGILLPNYIAYADTLLYLGLPLFLLLVAALSLPRVRPKMWPLVLLLLYAWLPSTSLGARLLQYLPLFNQVRAPARIWIMAFPWILFLAAAGLRVWASNSQWAVRWRRWGLVLLSAVLILNLGLIGWFRVYSTTWLGFGFLLLLVWLLWGRWLPRVPETRRTWILVLPVFLDQALLSFALLESRPLVEFFQGPQVQAAQFLVQQARGGPAFRTYSPSYTLPQHLTADLELEMADGIDPLYGARYDRFMELASGVPRLRYSVTVPYLQLPPEPETTPFGLLMNNRQFLPRPCLLGLLNVRYVLSNYALEHPQLVLQRRWGAVHVYENRCWRPRAFWAQGVQWLPEEEALWQALARAEDLSWVLLQGVPLAEAQRMKLTQGRVTWLLREPDRWRLRVEVPDQGFLVLSLPWHPDWRATLNGQPLTLERAYAALSGVWVPPGEYILELRFACPWYLWGWLLGLASWAATLLTLVVPVTRRLLTVRR